jgi:hypothetical protein
MAGVASWVFLHPIDVLKSLQQGAGAEAENAQLGTMQLLSPVRTHKRLESALGAASSVRDRKGVG